MSTLNFILTSLLVLIVLFGGRRSVVLAIFASGCYISIAQSFAIAGLDFSAFRTLIFFGILRVFFKREYVGFRLNRLDKSILLWITLMIAIYSLSRAGIEPFIYISGMAYNYIGLYFLFRILIREREDVLYIIQKSAILIMPLAILMLYEHISGTNLFHFVGGVPELAEVRYGRVRAQGVFRHPILAGTFGATSLAVFLATYKNRTIKKRSLALGIISSAVITYASSSSGPLLTAVAGIGALFMYRLRDHLKTIRWGAVASIITLHLLMAAPVWFLLAKIGKIAGGAGWHRAYLIDQAIRNFNEWWLLGIDNTGQWMPYQLAIDPNKADITNQYISVGVKGGIFTLLAFLGVLRTSFKRVGAYLKVEAVPEDQKFLVWGLGSALFAHCVAFISISYFDQIIIYFFILLVFINVATTIVHEDNSN